MKVTSVDIKKVVINKNQPRKYFDDEKIIQLSNSIKQFGVLQPIIVKELDGKYEIVAGERRFRACLLANLNEIPVVISSVDRYNASRIAIVENIQRENLTAIEEAYAYKSLIEDYALSQAEVSEAVGKKPSTISNKLRLLKLDKKVQDAIKDGSITERHGRALLNVGKEQQIQYLEKVKKEQLTVSNLEKIVSNSQNKPKKQGKKRIGVSNDYRLATNTIKQAISMIEQTGLKVFYEEESLKDGVFMSIKVTRGRKN